MGLSIDQCWVRLCEAGEAAQLTGARMTETRRLSCVCSLLRVLAQDDHMIADCCCLLSSSDTQTTVHINVSFNDRLTVNIRSFHVNSANYKYHFFIKSEN